MSDVPKTLEFEYHALVLHSEEEWGYAEQFCEQVRKCIDLPGGMSPKITTLEEFSNPGKQIIAILNEAMDVARFIFVSEEYYCTHHLGYFSGNVAIQCKMPDGFVFLKIEGQCLKTKDGTGRHVSGSLCGLHLGKTWEISESAEKKLQKIFLTQSLQSLEDKTQNLALTPSQNQQDKGMPEVLSAENLLVSNPSISSTSSMQSLGSSDETDVKNLASSPATVQNEATASKVENSGATPYSVNHSSDLTLFGEDLVDDKEEDVATTHAGVPVADPVPPVRHNQCKDTEAMNPSPQARNQENQAPNPGIQGQNQGPQPPTPRPLAPNLDCQTPKQGLVEQSQGSQGASTSSGGGTTANPAACGTAKSKINTLKGLQDKNKVPDFRAFETEGKKSMRDDGAIGGSVSSILDDVTARRERHANSAEKRLRDAKERDN